MLKRLRAPCDSSAEAPWRASGSRRDRRRARQGPGRTSSSARMASDAALRSRFCSAACRRLCSQARKDWIGPRPGPGPVSRSSLSTASIRACGIAGRRKPAGDDSKTIGQIGEDRFWHAGPRQEQERAKAFQAFAGAVHAAMPLGRCRQRAMGDLKLAKRHAPHSLAHRHCRIETIAHHAPWTDQ